MKLALFVFLLTLVAPLAHVVWAEPLTNQPPSIVPNVTGTGEKQRIEGYFVIYPSGKTVHMSATQLGILSSKSLVDAAKAAAKELCKLEKEGLVPEQISANAVFVSATWNTEKLCKSSK